MRTEDCLDNRLIEGLQRLLGGSQIRAVVDKQLGDTGKGKAVHLVAAVSDVCARGTGGGNAGHTRVLNGNSGTNHLLPIGIVYDSEGKISIMGNGMVIDPGALCGELEGHLAAGGTYNNLMISEDAHVTFPYHLQRDIERNKSQRNGGIGSTGRGIGPTYADKVNRRGITMGDILQREILVRKLAKLRDEGIYPNLDIDEMVAWTEPFAERLAPLIRNTVTEMHRFVREGRRIVLEGAQGLLLSVEHGVHPYVTSSDCSVNGTAGGVGLSATDVDLVLGIVKFPFMTRVGGGPLPTELGGRRSQEYCAEEDEDKNCVNIARAELARYRIPFQPNGLGIPKYDHNHPAIKALMNSSNPLKIGIGIRLAAGEYGATTGRPRRIGWADGVSGAYAAAINGALRGRVKLILTCPDVVSGMNEFCVAESYSVDGRETREFRRDSAWLSRVKPNYRTYKGYGEMAGETDFQNLPETLKVATSDFETMTGAPVAAISTGPDRNHIAIR